MPLSLNRLIAGWQMVAKRSLSNWRLLSSVVLGVLLASAILSGAVIYFDALRELALKNSLGKHSDVRIDVLVRGQRGPTTYEEFDKVAAVVQEATDSHVEWMLKDRIAAGKSPTFFLTLPGEEAAAGRDDGRAYFAFLPRIFTDPEKVTVLPGGTLPTDGRLNPPGGPLELEALVPSEAADQYGVGVGDYLVAISHWKDVTPQVNVRISGLFRRNDPNDEIWFLESEVLNAATGPSFRTVPFFLSQKAYMEVLGPSFLKMDSTYMWLLDVDAERINALNASRALNDLGVMHQKAASSLTSYVQTTALDNALREYDRRLFFSKLPMYVVLILIAVVVLYYVVTLSSLMVEERRSEVALLRSRGASSAQILAVFLLEGATIAVIAAIAGPYVAAGTISILGYTPAFSDLSGGGRVAVALSREAYLMSALGGVLSFVALIIPAVQASRIGVTHHRQQSARPTNVPAFQRYYLDVLLLLVSIVLFRQLTEQGSVVATTVFGDVAVNQLLLVIPGIVLVASAMVLLRLFPVVMSLASRVLSTSMPAGVVLGMWQMARNATHYARLSLLLILVAGLGIFASSFGATVDLSFEERIVYSTGGDIRVNGVRPLIRTTRFSGFRRRGSPPPEEPSPIETPKLDLVSTYQGVPGVDVVSAVFRSPGSDLTKSFGQNFELLAMDAESFQEVATFRDDFSSRPMQELLESLEVANPPEGLYVGDGISAIAVRLKADRSQPTVRVTARLRDEAGNYSTYPLGNLDSSGWTVLETSRSPTTVRLLQSKGPTTLVSLRVEETNGTVRLQAGSILLDHISVTDADGATREVERFNDAGDWTPLKVTADAVGDVLHGSELALDGSSGSVLFSWTSGPALTARGIFRGTGRSPLPVLASKSFARSTGHSPGREFDVSVGGYRVPVQLVDTIDLFPTMTTPDQPFLIADLDSLTDYTNLGAIVRQMSPNEVWLSTTSSGRQREALIGYIEGIEGYSSSVIHDRAKLLAASTVDPLVKAGWRALLFMAFGTVLVLSCLGFLVHAYVSFRNRQLQFALLRTVGLSMRQLAAMVWLEQTLVVATGVALGLWMGGRLGATIMPFLGHDDWGFRVMPPYRMEVDWGALLVTYAAIALVFLVISLGLAWLIHRIALQRTLRLGEL